MEHFADSKRFIRHQNKFYYRPSPNNTYADAVYRSGITIEDTFPKPCPINSVKYKENNSSRQSLFKVSINSPKAIKYNIDDYTRKHNQRSKQKSYRKIMRLPENNYHETLIWHGYIMHVTPTCNHYYRHDNDIYSDECNWCFKLLPRCNNKDCWGCDPHIY